MHSDLDAEQAWERLRASHWSPPGRAAGGSRQKTYAAALEQSEQTFQAAAAVGTATRPMQVFYGLSQAGRAIAAAAWTRSTRRALIWSSSRRRCRSDCSLVMTGRGGG